MNGAPGAGANTTRNATLLDPRARTAVPTALRPTLDARAVEACTDARLSLHAHSADNLALADLTSRPTTRTPPALHELEARGYLACLTSIVARLTAALPAPI